MCFCDSVGLALVDAMYQYDASYAVSVQRAHPDRFALVKPVVPDDPAVADVIAAWKKTPGTVGIRIIMTKEAKTRARRPGFDRILRAAVQHNFPVNVLFWGNLDAGMALIDRHPDARFIIDHMGILQPSVPPAPPQPWADIPKVVELAKAQECGDQDYRRLHAVKGAISISGHLGPACPHIRRLGFRSLPLGDRLDASICRR